MEAFVEDWSTGNSILIPCFDRDSFGCLLALPPDSDSFVGDPVTASIPLRRSYEDNLLIHSVCEGMTKA